MTEEAELLRVIRRLRRRRFLFYAGVGGEVTVQHVADEGEVVAHVLEHLPPAPQGCRGVEGRHQISAPPLVGHTTELGDADLGSQHQLGREVAEGDDNGGVDQLELGPQVALAGVDSIAAQGSEAGGHTGHSGTLPLVPAVIDVAGDIPVIAAGGIADGRGLAAVLMLVALAIAACGSGDPATATETATAQPASVVVEGAQPGVAAASPNAVAPRPTPTASAVQTPTPEPPPAPTATPTPVPGSAAEIASTPSPTPEATAEVVRSLRASRLGEEAMRFLQDFTRDFSPRASGTDEERRAAEFLASEFEALGYRTELQPFTVDVESAAVRVGTERTEFQALPMTLSGMGVVSGKLVNVGKARDGDLPEERIDGRIVVIQRGEITFGEKVSRVTDAGAVGAIVYNNEAG
ncbi:MAG: nitronate monooxygenase, partial [Acidobacteria bacterium]|nr:nitronate monooxygenase [Acidobacteriota bacterium]